MSVDFVLLVAGAVLSLIAATLTALQFPWVWKIRVTVEEHISALQDEVEATKEAILQLDQTLVQLKEATTPGQLQGGHDPRELQALGVEKRLERKADRALANHELAQGILGRFVKDPAVVSWLWDHSGLVDDDMKEMLAAASESGISRWAKSFLDRNGPVLGAALKARQQPAKGPGDNPYLT